MSNDEETDRPVLGYINGDRYSLAAPHSEDSFLIYVPEERAIFVGDADCGDYYNNAGKYDKNKLENYIELIRGIDFNTCLLGHDKPESREEVLKYLDEQLHA